MNLLAALVCALGIQSANAAEEQDLTFDLEGYYRTRGYVFKDLFEAPVSGPASTRPGPEPQGRNRARRCCAEPDSR